MFHTLVNAFKDRDVRRKILLTFLFIVIFRIGCYIPVPGLDIDAVQGLFSGENAGFDFFSVMATITGGSLSNGTLFALGIVPYINSFIIMQLLTLVIPPLERLSKGGEEGRAKMVQITRYVAIVLGIVQAIGIVISWNNSGAIRDVFTNGETLGTVFTMIMVIIILTGGSVGVMWIAEKITEYGISNGTSIIIFVGIIATAGTNFISAFQTATSDTTVIWYILGYILIVIAVFALIVFVDLSERRITVVYAKQVKGNKMYGGQSSNIPIRVNASGVMPIIFASSFLMFPQMIASFWPESDFYIWYSQYLGTGTWAYSVLMFLLIIFFSYFYAQIQFNPDDIARNIQQYAGSIPGIRPGKPTSDYLRRINNRITLFGALFLAFVALIPSLIFTAIGQKSGTALYNAFSATGMLIVVSVALELNKQLESQIMMKHYKGFLK